MLTNFKEKMFDKEKIRLKDILDHLLKIRSDDDEDLMKYVEKYIQKFDRLGDKNQNIFYAFSYTILAMSALTPLLNAIVPYTVFEVKVYTTVLAVITAVSVGILQITQAFDKVTLEKVTRIYLEREILLYKTKGGIYSKENNPKLKEVENVEAERRKLFSQRIAEIIVNKFNKYYALSPRGRFQNV